MKEVKKKCPFQPYQKQNIFMHKKLISVDNEKYVGIINSLEVSRSRQYLIQQMPFKIKKKKKRS